MMGPPGYPPATGQGTINIPQRPTYEGGQSRFRNFRRDDKSEWWNLPSTGAMFILPHQLGKFDEIYSVSEGIDDTEQIGGGLIETIYTFRESDQSYWLGKSGEYRAQIKVPQTDVHLSLKNGWGIYRMAYRGGSGQYGGSSPDPPL